MKESYVCTSVKEFNAMLKEIKKFFFTEVEFIYNVGSNQFYEYPLFIFTSGHVFRIYFSDGTLSLTPYEKDHFLEMVEVDIVRYSDDPTDFDYIYRESNAPFGKICNLLPEKGCGTKNNLLGLNLVFSDGNILSIRSSYWVDGAMDSHFAKQ